MCVCVYCVYSVRDGFNMLCFIALTAVSGLVLPSLMWGMESLPTTVFRLVTWICLYFWLTALSLRSVQQKYEPTVSWKNFCSFKWLGSNLLQTKAKKTNSITILNKE